MRIVVLVCLISLISAGDLLSKYQIIGMKKPKMKDILMEVQAQIKSGGAIETQLSYLDNLKATIDAEQIRHDQLFTDQRNQCSAELELRQKDIKDAAQVSNRANEQLENCQQTEQKSQTELENILQNQKATDGDIQILASIRDAGNLLFQNKKQDHIDGLRSLQECQKLLDGYQGGETSLAELSEISLQMIQDSVKLGGSSTLAEISGIFAQVLTENGGYLEVYEKLKSLLTALEQTLFKNLQKYQEEEDTSISEYDDRRVHLIEYFNNLKKTEQELRDHISAMSLCQDQQVAILESARGKKIRNSELYDSASKMCSDFQNEYDKATAVRKSEIDLIAEVKSAIIDRTVQYRAKPQF